MSDLQEKCRKKLLSSMLGYCNKFAQERISFGFNLVYTGGPPKYSGVRKPPLRYPYPEPTPVGDSPECNGVLGMADLLLVAGDLREMGYDASIHSFYDDDTVSIDLSSEVTDREVPVKEHRKSLFYSN